MTSNWIRHSQDTRIFFDQPVVINLQESDNPVHGRALNLSPGGIFICAEILLPLSSSLHVSFFLPDGHLVNTEATVVRLVTPDDATEPSGMALVFEEISEESTQRIQQFIEERIRPATGEAVSLKLGDQGVPIRARAHSTWDNILCVDAELPFLQLGSPVKIPVQVPERGDGQGSIRWVSVNVPPETGIPKINIGIEMDPLDEEYQADDLTWEDDEDPVYTSEFADHSFELDRVVRSRGR